MYYIRSYASRENARNSIKLIGALPHSAAAKSVETHARGVHSKYLFARLQGYVWVLETQLTKKLASMTRGDVKNHVKIGSHVIGLIRL